MALFEKTEALSDDEVIATLAMLERHASTRLKSALTMCIGACNAASQAAAEDAVKARRLDEPVTGVSMSSRLWQACKKLRIETVGGMLIAVDDGRFRAEFGEARESEAVRLLEDLGLSPRRRGMPVEGSG